MSANKRLGRGLDALLGASSRGTAASGKTPDSEYATSAMPVTALVPGRYQPRLAVDEASLAELADSIRAQGVLQPLVVRPIPDAASGAPQHEIVAGERRWRAAQLAGLATVPVVVRELDDQSALAVALIENLQREDLNPVEQARSLARLAEEFSLTHQQVAAAVGRSRSSVSNLMRLLDLDDTVKQQLADGGIDMGHARALLALDGAAQVRLAHKTQRAGWSVRQTENAVRQHLARATRRPPPASSADLQTRWLQQQIAGELGQKVRLRPTHDGSYKLDVEFADLDQLRAALQKIQALVEQLKATAGPRARDRGK